MAAKSVLLGGLGTIMINPIAINQKEYETVDPAGRPVQSKMVGTRAKTVYTTEDGSEIPSTQLCKRIEVEGEDLILPKFNPSKEIPEENVNIIDDASLVYTAIERKFYNVVTDNQKIKDLVLKENKSIEYPFAAGGWKIWRAILTNWNGKLLMVCCIGDLKKELEKYSEETVELEIEAIPQTKNMKKLMMALV